MPKYYAVRTQKTYDEHVANGATMQANAWSNMELRLRPDSAGPCVGYDDTYRSSSRSGWLGSWGFTKNMAMRAVYND